MEEGTTNIIQGLEKWQKTFSEDEPEAPATTYLLQGLSPNSYYQITIIARNDLGESDESSTFVFKTSEGKFSERFIYFLVVTSLFEHN